MLCSIVYTLLLTVSSAPYCFWLYIRRFEDALSDFGDVVQLVPNLAAGHVNIGLIYLKHYKNVQK